MRSTLRALFLIALFVLPACAGRVDYRTLNGYMRANECSRASEYLSQNRAAYGRNQQLLYHLDSAIIAMVCGHHAESNKHFHDAEELSEALWTRSITKEAASFLLNDYTIPYSGEDFERALINLFSAINYAMLGDYDGALVECRKLDATLSMFNRHYETKNVYKEDALGRYLSGILYEAAGNIDDAFIDYFKAYNVYQDYYSDYGTPVPTVLIEDLFRLGDAVGRMEELRSVHGYGDTRWLSIKETKGFGKIVFIHLNGAAPVKKDSRIFVATPRGPVTIAFPTFTVIPPLCRGGELILFSESEKVAAATELAEDINRIAVKNLDDRRGRLVAKVIARVIAKQVAIEQATKDIKDKETRELTRVLLNIINMAIERADTRSWRTLPGEISLTRMYVPAGTYAVRVRSCANTHEVLPFIAVASGETKFVVFDTMY